MLYFSLAYLLCYLQKNILSLAVNFHPHDVALLLIDYKGGGMANLFKNLPHLLGTITNLDGAQSMRALASINAEIHRRERLFGEFEVNHINQYQKKFKNGEATEPLPHLFLISDEFAELKVNQPDFIKELVSIARVGRSLGVHLILATQKPSGVVDDQIWSNSRFKIALKVADTMLLDQTEKISKFVRIMEKELNRRKKLLADYGVGTLELYRQASGQEEPAIVILLDSYEAFKEEAYEAELFKLLVRISREGLSIGVHLLVTAGRQTNLRAQLYSNFKHQLSLPQNEAGEVRAIVGSTPLAMTMEDIKGRALMKREEVDVIQLALPVYGANDTQVLNNLRQEVASLQEAWTGQRPSAIPMVPEELTEADFYSRASVQAAYEQGLVPLGLDLETVEPVTWNLAKGNLLYLTDKEEQMAALVKHIAKGKQKVIVLAPKYHNLPEMEGVTILASPEEYLEGLDMMEFKIQERLEGKQRDHVATVVVYNLTELVVELNSEALDSLAYVLDKGIRAGYGSLVMSSPLITKHIDVVSKTARSYKQAILALRLSDQSVLTVTNKPVREPQLEEQEHYYVSDGLASRMKVLMI